VDLIHLILCLNSVINSLCLSDLPVSGQITAFAISGMMMTLSLAVLFLFFVFVCAAKLRNNGWPD
jgi:hypothetical protein